MLVLVIVLAAIVLLALLIGFGGFGGGYGPDAPTVYRRVIYRRPARRVITEHHVVDDLDPIDRPTYRP
ncbi:MAG: hypothetical protein JO079_07855 [Frankiaceae bacterium]|nr:hypothetical protein [Frankiaceae bacterium]MBV9369747.1 hypothetical protein [Frankiales bacterium]